VTVQAVDHLSMAGLTRYLDGRPEITLQEQHADVLVMAASRLSTEVIADLRRATVPVVLVLDEVGDVDVLTIVDSRVVAVLPRAAATGDRVLRSVLAAADGGGVLPPNLVAELMEHLRRLRRELMAPTTGDGRLTAREVDVLRLMADGMDTAEIATKLSYSERTVKNVFYGLTNRLHLRNRPHAVAYALRKGMI
jgi:DNA-binding NarL/FixJ family response regulator